MGIEIMDSETIVDRSFEHYEEDPEIVVILPDGYRARFWETGLSDEEYICRTEKLREIDKRRKKQ
jgi:hypothetical protein